MSVFLERNGGGALSKQQQTSQAVTCGQISKNMRVTKHIVFLLSSERATIPYLEERSVSPGRLVYIFRSLPFPGRVTHVTRLSFTLSKVVLRYRVRGRS